MNAPARAADEHRDAPGGAPRRLAGAGEPPGTGRPRWAAIVTALVVAATVAVRLWPLISRHMLGGLLEYDDGVYYNASAHLIGGALPYRDFVFVQPPGVLLLLAPFGALARVAGDQAAMTAARVAMIIVAAGNAWLLMRLTRRWSGGVAAAAAGATYAVWGGAAAAERTVLLEPLLGLGLLGAMTLLDAREPTGAPPRRTNAAARLVAAGVILGFALTVKTWAVADIAVLAGWLLWRSGWRPGWLAGWRARRRRGWRAALTLAGPAFAAAALVCLPFFAAAPGAMVHQVILDQLGRTERLTPDPVVFLHEVAGFGQVYGRAGAAPGVAIAVLALLAAAVLCTLWRGPRIWAVLAIAQLALVLPQRSYTYHYIDFAAPALAACAGVAAAAVLRAVRPGRFRGPAPSAAVGAMMVALAAFGWQSVTQDVVGSRVPPALGSFFAAHPCAFSDYPSLLAATGAETRQVRLHCGNLVDYTGAALSAGDGRMLVPLGHSTRGRLYCPASWQAQVRGVLAASDAAVLSWRPQRWTPDTWQFFHQRFRMSSRVGYFTLWTLR